MDEPKFQSIKDEKSDQVEEDFEIKDEPHSPDSDIPSSKIKRRSGKKGADTKKQKTFNCSKCGDSFLSLKELSIHKNKNHMNAEFVKESKPRRSPSPEKNRCEVCFKKLRTHLALENHMIIFHTQEYPHYCEYCGKGFTNTEFNRRFEQHLKKCQVTPKVPMTKTCHICFKSFEKASNYKRHIQHHTERRDCSQKQAL